MQLELENSAKLEAEKNPTLEEMTSEREGLIAERDAAVTQFMEKEKAEELRSLNSLLHEEKESTRLELDGVREKLESAESEITKMREKQIADGEERDTLTSKVSQLEGEIKVAESKFQDLVIESSRVSESLVQKERELSSHLQSHEAHKEEAKEKLESAEREIADIKQMQKAAEEESTSLTLKISQLEDEVRKAETRIQDLVAESSRVTEKLEEKERELSAHMEMHESDKEQASIRARDLELELDSSHGQRRDIEKQKSDEISALLQKLEDQEKESLAKTNGLKEQIKNVTDQFHGKQLELEKRVKDLELELSSSCNQKLELEEHVKVKSQELSESVAQIETLKEGLEKRTEEQHKVQEEREVLALQVKDLQEELRRKGEELKESLEERGKLQEKTAEVERSLTEKESEQATLKKKFEDGEREKLSRITALTADVSSLQEQLGSLGSLKSGADIILEKRSREISELLLQIEKLKEELSGKAVDGEKFLEEKTSLESKISGLENTLTERGNELIAVQHKLESLQNEASTEISALKEQIESSQKQLELLESQKSLLEVDIEKNKQETKESLVLAEIKNGELVNKIMEQEKNLKEQEDRFIKLCEEHNQLKVEFHNCEERLALSEKKIEEITQQFGNDMSAKDGEVNELEENIEALKRDLEIKEDEISTVVEDMRNIEVKQRLTSQKLRIAEQLLSEKDERYLKREEKLQEEQKLLEDKVDTYKEAQVKVVTEISEKVNGTLTSIDAFHMKFEEDYGHLESRVYEIVHELRVTTTCIKDSNIEKYQLRKEIASLAQQLSDERDRVMQLKERITELETTTQKHGDEKESLITTVKARETKMGELEKTVAERDEKVGELERKMKENTAGFDSLIEEKREAIRQLCIWIEYHRSRYDELKEMIAKTRGRRGAS